jgi:hypothetical protein
MKISFTGLDISSDELVHKDFRETTVSSPPWDYTWESVTVDVGFVDNQLKEFLVENFKSSQWDYYSIRSGFSYKIVVGFKNPTDAMMFKLKWREVEN